MSEKIRTKIVGVTFTNEDGMERQQLLSMLSAGDSLSLKDTSSDKYPEAIGVFNSDGEQLGSLRKDLALSLREMDGDFEDFPVSVLEVTGGGDKNYGCNIVITPDDFFTCRIIIKDKGAVGIQTPLLKTPNTVVPSSIESIRLVKTDDSFSVVSSSNEFLGFLPPFACEQIQKRNLDTNSNSGSILDSRTDSDGDLHIGISIDLTPKKEEPIPPKEETAPTQPKQAPLPNRFESNSSSNQSSSNVDSFNSYRPQKKKSALGYLFWFLLIAILVVFVAPYFLSMLHAS